MFVNKVGYGLNKQIGFKGYASEVDNNGYTVTRFNIPFDHNKQKARVEIYKVRKDPKAYCGYVVADKDHPIATYDLQKGGTVVDIDSLLEFDDDEPYAYRIVVDGKPVRDTGIALGNEPYMLVSRTGTTPMVQGVGCILMPDALPVLEKKNGKYVLNRERQAEAEASKRTYGNIFGGNIQSLTAMINSGRFIPDIVASTPILSGDNTTSHLYCNENNFQVSQLMGNVDDFDELIVSLFKHGKKFMYDAPLTSEGLHGMHFQRALKWASKGYYTEDYYMFNMESIKDEPITAGIIPINTENCRVRFINPQHIIEQDGTKVKYRKNLSYNSDKPSYLQFYDKRFVTDAQLAKYEVILAPEKLGIDDKMGVNTYKDTTCTEAFPICDWKSILSNIDKLNELGLKLDSPEGAITIANTPYLKFGVNTSGAITWDQNNTLIKRRKAMSAYDEKQLSHIPLEGVRNFERAKYVRGVNNNIDEDTQVLAYWAERIKNTEILYIAKTLKGANTVDEIRQLIDEGKLPEQAARLTKEKIENIQEGFYNLSIPTGYMDTKRDVTASALMKLPLPSLELDKDTFGLLASSYFTNKAAKEEQIGKTRYELEQEFNPHLNKLNSSDDVTPAYANTYRQMCDLFRVDIADFAEAIIKELDNLSDEKLLDSDGNYTEYGEYIINLYGMEIAKYAIFKSLLGDKFNPEFLDDGSIKYDYDYIRENTSLNALGINAHTPDEEANALLWKISYGLVKLNETDIDNIAQALNKQLEGTTTESFRLADAMYIAAGLGMDVRFDATKDHGNMDDVRNRTMSFDRAWEQLFILNKLVKAVKQYNPNANIMGELTDVYQVMSAIFGEGFDYASVKALGGKFGDPEDAILQFLDKTGITTEAGYPFFFTNLINVFSRDFTDGTKQNNAISNLRETLRRLINTRNPDYIRNMMNFTDNQDKPRPIQYMALDLGLFYGEVVPVDKNNMYNHELNKSNRELAMMLIAGVDELKDMPLELRLNIDNIDYVRTISNRAVAMSKLLKDSMDGIDIPAEVRKYMLKALGDLTEGKYKDYLEINREVINIPELKSMDKALDAVLVRTKLSDDKKAQLKNALINKVNSDMYVYKNLVVGQITDERNIGRLNGIMGENVTPEDAKKYSLYTVCIASIIKEVAKDMNVDCKAELDEGIKAFVEEFNASKVAQGSSKLHIVDTIEEADRKSGYASNQIEYNISMLIDQAEYLARKDGMLEEDEYFENTSQIMAKMFRNATEPAVQKYIRMMAVLMALPGMPTYYIGDEIGSTGGEEKAKNMFLQNRNILKFLDLAEGINKEYRQRILEMVENVQLIRSRYGIEALNNGTPYMLNCADNRVITYMMQGANGDVVVPIINMSGVDQEARVKYYSGKDEINSINKDNIYVPGMDTVELDCIELPNNISLPEGTILRNTDTTDKQVYKVVKKGDRCTIRREDNGFGDKIVLNGDTAKYGVLILTSVAALASGAMFKKSVMKNSALQKPLKEFLRRV